MTVDVDLSTPLGQVRAIIGDSEGILIEDSVINYILSTNDDNVNQTAIECLRYIVADLAKLTHEKVDREEAWLNETYEHYKDLLDKLLTDPNYALYKPTILFGGVSKTEKERVYGDSDGVRNTFKNNWLDEESSGTTNDFWDGYS